VEYLLKLTAQQKTKSPGDAGAFVFNDRSFLIERDTLPIGLSIPVMAWEWIFHLPVDQSQ
jgi:hypothetical protein